MDTAIRLMIFLYISITIKEEDTDFSFFKSFLFMNPDDLSIQIERLHTVTTYDVVPKEEIAEFEELMRKTIADIVSEASSVACWVYVQKYVKHKTLNEMLLELPDVSQFILAMDTWFEKLMVIEAIIEADNEMQRIKDKIGMLHEI